ncbi:MAG: 30S ribosomal protein S20 [Phycisphaerales bacterium]|nr:30S ribosomal protein S20 [Phycisphaerales bacterium]
MAHSRSARKRVRQNASHRARNRWRLRQMRLAIKDFLVKCTSGSKDEARDAYRTASALIDKSAAKGVIHKNQAARRKSRLNARLKAMSN